MKNREDLEVACRAAYENRYHKIKAEVGYDEWRAAYMAGWTANPGWQAGWQACVIAWADHMTAINKALEAKGARMGTSK